MPLFTPFPRRALRRTRVINVTVFRRDSGIPGIDARFGDRCPVDAAPLTGVLPAALPLHDLHLRLTIDAATSIVDAALASDAVPASGSCNTAGLRRRVVRINRIGASPARGRLATGGDVRRLGNGMSLPLFFPQY